MRGYILFCCIIAVLGVHLQMFVRGQEENFVEEISNLIPPDSGNIFSRTSDGVAVVEGDIMVPVSEEWAIASKYANGAGPRGIMAYTNYYWPVKNDILRIPYEIGDTVDEDMRDSLKKAIAGFKSSTCVRFVPRKEQTDYVYIQHVKDGGCGSFIGKLGGKQTITLENKSCQRIGTVQHELMHTLGFFHEHTRQDRDEYVKINTGNILAGRSGNFAKRRTVDFDSEYDFYSTMHYPLNAFSKDKSKLLTIKVLEAAGIDVSRIGQREGMSPEDIYQVNRLYCNQKPTLSTPPVQSTTTIPSTTAVKKTAAPSPTCVDIRSSDRCLRLKTMGYCRTGLKKMITRCQNTCNLCALCFDVRDTARCEKHKTLGYCSNGMYNTHIMCRKTCGRCA